MRYVRSCYLSFICCLLMVGCGSSDQGPVELYLVESGIVIAPGDVHTVRVVTTEAPGHTAGHDGIVWRLEGAGAVQLGQIQAFEAGVYAVANGMAVVWASARQQHDSASIIVRSGDPASQWREISPGVGHTCGVLASGRAYCWGPQRHGALGNGIDRETIVPTPVPVNSEVDFARLAGGHSFTCGLTIGGEVHCWGLEEGGRLGAVSERAVRLTPSIVSLPDIAVSIEVQSEHACALTEAGKRYCWGSNAGSRLGIVGPEVVTQPTEGLGEPSFSRIALGEAHGCGVTVSQELMCWGRNDVGQAGSHEGESLATPTLVESELEFVDVSAGSRHTCALVEIGEVYCFGVNTSLQLGSLGIEWSPDPKRVASPVPFVRLASSNETMCGLTYEGRAYCWGSNRFGEMGTTADMRLCQGGAVPYPCSELPLPVEGDDTFRSIAGGGFVVFCGITEQSFAKCWGSNRTGGLGIGRLTLENQSVPERVIDGLVTSQ